MFCPECWQRAFRSFVVLQPRGNVASRRLPADTRRYGIGGVKTDCATGHQL